MPRRRTRAGEHGTISARKTNGRWTAETRIRDHDGILRQMRRYGPTKTAAINNLEDAIEERTGTGTDGDAPFPTVAQRWLREFQEKVDSAERSPTSLRVYEVVLNTHILPALQELTIYEAADAPRLNAFIKSCRRHNGAATTKTARTVLNGILGYAVAHGAIKSNPMREVQRVAGATRSKPRSLTAAERDAWFTALDNDQQAKDRDIPDLCRFLLATGVRIGEALAVTFDEIDLESGTVSVLYTIVPIKGVGLRRKPTKTRAGERVLRIPRWCVEMLTRRHSHYGGVGPVFPALLSGSWRDPSNTAADIREARDKAGFEWLTSHVFRKTVATELEAAGMSAREVADQLGHAKISMTQDVYFGRSSTTDRHAEMLERLQSAE